MKGQINYLRLALKTVFIVILISFVLLPVLSASVGKLSLYNWLLPGRERLPFSDTPQKAYNLSLDNLDAMFASHQVSAQKEPESEYRIFILGDSSTWGTLLEPDNTLAGQLNQLDIVAADGKPLRFYNLGYPTLSLSKDLMLLQRAMVYDPDLIIWLVTLESFPADKQLTSPLVENNPKAIQSLFDQYELDPLLYGSEELVFSYWDSTLFGQRRNLADIIRLQLYGVMWAVTGIDQYYPDDYQEAARDLTDDLTYHGWQEGEMKADQLALELLTKGKEITADVPILYVNEPILISQGLNSDIRYNFYYPRWAFDDFRDLLDDFQNVQGLSYLDYWNLVPSEEFTNTAIHYTSDGVRMFVDELLPFVMEYFP